MTNYAIWRDDDFSDKSKIVDLERLIEISSQFGFLSVACIPSLANDADVFYDAKDNTNALRGLKKHVQAGRISVWQHGLTHIFNGVPEFEMPIMHLEYQLNTAKSYLYECTGAIPNVFVPPHNSICKANYYHVTKCFKYLSTSFCHLPHERPLSFKYLKKFTSCALNCMFSPSKKNYSRSWVDVKYNGCTEIESVGYIPQNSIDKLQISFEEYKRNSPKTPFKFNTHYWELTDSMLNDLEHFLRIENIKLISL